MGIEIEKKFTVKMLPEDLEKYPFHEIEQGYLNVHPAIRVRRQDDIYYMTYKSSAISENTDNIGQTEYNMPLDEQSYRHLAGKTDGNVIRKRRYLIPINEDAYPEMYLQDNPELGKLIKEGKMVIELDVFREPFEGTMVAEVEFPSEEAAAAYRPASWFDKDVTADPRYRNSYMSSMKI